MIESILIHRIGQTGFFRWVWIVVAMFTLASCGDGDNPAPPAAAPVTACLNASDSDPGAQAANASNSRIIITNEESALDALITCANAEITVDNSTLAPASASGAPIGIMAKVSTGFSLTLVAEALPPKIVGAAAKVPTPAGPDDLTAGGTFTGPVQDPPYVRYIVEIDGVGTPDTFRWSEDDGFSWAASGVNITDGVAQALSNGVTVTFAALAGHTSGSQWRIDAGTLQATSVAIKGNSAIVSYGMIGEPFLGAIQVYNLKNGTVHLKSQALFRDMDINAVTVSASNAYLVGAHEPTPANASVIETLTVAGTKLQLGGNITELHSFAATSVFHDTTNAKVLITDGNDGGLAVLDESSLAEDPVSPILLPDARWVSMENLLAVVMQGCCAPLPPAVSAKISLYDMTGGTPAFLRSFPITGADIPASKSTVELVGAKAFIAAGSGGAQVWDTGIGGTMLASIPVPGGTGLPADRIVANAVTVDADLMFISNGEAGVYVAQATSGNFDASPSTGPVTLSNLGKLQFGSLESVNHVEYKNGYLFVAAGLGGLKVVNVTLP